MRLLQILVAGSATMLLAGCGFVVAPINGAQLAAFDDDVSIFGYTTTPNERVIALAFNPETDEYESVDIDFTTNSPVEWPTTSIGTATTSLGPSLSTSGGRVTIAPACWRLRLRCC